MVEEGFPRGRIIKGAAVAHPPALLSLRKKANKRGDQRIQPKPRKGFPPPVAVAQPPRSLSSPSPRLLFTSGDAARFTPWPRSGCDSRVALIFPPPDQTPSEGHFLALPRAPASFSRAWHSAGARKGQQGLFLLGLPWTLGSRSLFPPLIARKAVTMETFGREKLNVPQSTARRPCLASSPVRSSQSPAQGERLQEAERS